MNAREYAQKRVDDKLLGYKIRTKLFSGEDNYFKQNPNVAGMANFETNDIILNPYSRGRNMEAVAMNEAMRLKMAKEKFIPNIELTDKQKEFFQGTAYENNEDAMKQTIFARIYSGDSSANATENQIKLYKEYIGK